MSEKWIWGKICGYKIGDKVRLIRAYPISKSRLPSSHQTNWDYDLLKPGTEGRIIQVLFIANTTVCIVDFDVEGGSHIWVTEYEIEPV